MQFPHLTDKTLKQRLELEWQAVNDYVGMACYQMENDTPLCWTLAGNISAGALVAHWVASPRFDDKRLQQDGEFTRFWAGNVFISRRRGVGLVLQLLWCDAQNQIQPGYIYTLTASTAARSVSSGRSAPRPVSCSTLSMRGISS
ncbi:MAG: hypothetical protein ACR5LG_00045 [Sodalis sp. (in: enterobacteria)]|uniref:hypothetical protein n=1 Tax=Sodalis sp. (in: enterobacteria) TaxID=1898979 RepID=UPI003F334000